MIGTGGFGLLLMDHKLESIFQTVPTCVIKKKTNLEKIGHKVLRLSNTFEYNQLIYSEDEKFFSLLARSFRCQPWNIVMTTAVWLTSLRTGKPVGGTDRQFFVPRRISGTSERNHFQRSNPIFQLYFWKNLVQSVHFEKWVLIRSYKRLILEWSSHYTMAHRGRDTQYNDDSAVNLLRSVRQQVSYILSFVLDFNVINIISLSCCYFWLWSTHCMKFWGQIRLLLLNSLDMTPQLFCFLCRTLLKYYAWLI